MKVNIGKYPKTKPQRVSVEIERHDTWNMAYTLAYVIYPMLLKLREEKVGVPSVLTEDVGGEDYVAQSSFDFYKESSNAAFEVACKRWDDILDKMIWSFGQLIEDDWESQYHHGHAEYDWVKSDKLYPNPISGVMEATYQMVDKNPDEHWFDSVGHQEHAKRIQEGFDLFGKYYQNLWD